MEQVGKCTMDVFKSKRTSRTNTQDNKHFSGEVKNILKNM